MATMERWPSVPTEEPVAAVVNDHVDEGTADEPVSAAPPIRSRFLFVNVAAMRAKQLRRGAKPRVESIDGCQKAEHLAMEEIRRGLIPYDPRDHDRDLTVSGQRRPPK